MKKDTNHFLKLGAIVLTGLLLFIGIIYYLGKQQYLFSSVIKINSVFNNVQGLKVGNNVRYAGITIGTISDIKIISDTSVLVEMIIRHEVARFIREDAVAEIAADGLMGSRIINIYPGSNQMPPIDEGSTITSQMSISIENFADEAEKILLKSQEITSNLEQISAKINRGEGDLGKLLNDTTITSQLKFSANKMADITISLDDITSKISSGEGDFGKMIYNEELTGKMNSIMERIDCTSVNIQKFASDIQLASEQLHSGSGVFNQLLFDSVLAKKLDTGIDAAIEAAETVDNSWLLNMFSGKKKKKNNDLPENLVY